MQSGLTRCSDRYVCQPSHPWISTYVQACARRAFGTGLRAGRRRGPAGMRSSAALH